MQRSSGIFRTHRADDLMKKIEQDGELLFRRMKEYRKYKEEIRSFLGSEIRACSIVSPGYDIPYAYAGIDSSYGIVTTTLGISRYSSIAVMVQDDTKKKKGVGKPPAVGGRGVFR